jgi:DEAD/DEAH box helicase domain-containing protein
MRETYPGAVYYYTTIPFRVYRVDFRSRDIMVRKEKRYTTRPTRLPTQVFPNLVGASVYRAVRAGDLVAVECDVQIRESVVGFKERRGSNEENYAYPLDRPASGLRYTKQFFTRNFFTTGVILSHPALNRDRVDASTIASLLYEAFLVVIPFERRDLSFGADKYRARTGPLTQNDAFVCVYDQTYGSLRLSGRILETEVLHKTFEQLVELAEHDETSDLNDDTLMAVHALASWSPKDMNDVTISDTGMVEKSAGKQRVIMPGSKGLWLLHGNEEVTIEGIFFSPAKGTVCYRARLAHETGPQYDRAQWIVPLGEVSEIPGESVIGLYDESTGEAKPLNERPPRLRGPGH